jgi:hypothetical protein
MPQYKVKGHIPGCLRAEMLRNAPCKMYFVVNKYKETFELVFEAKDTQCESYLKAVAHLNAWIPIDVTVELWHPMVEELNDTNTSRMKN